MGRLNTYQRQVTHLQEVLSNKNKEVKDLKERNRKLQYELKAANDQKA